MGICCLTFSGCNVSIKAETMNERETKLSKEKEKKKSSLKEDIRKIKSRDFKH